MAGKVIEAKAWVHIPSGRKASLYGACPWRTEAEKANWRIEVFGFTVQHPDGTIGIGLVPFPDRKQAQDWVDAHPNFRGMNSD
jgi:hypothetical protein